jgi:hypothetical protein
MSNRNIAGKPRVFCRNQNCRTKLATPTDNHHKAFCAPYCHTQFYRRKCLVCERPLPEGHRRQLCSSRQCKLDYRNFRPSYVLENASSLSPEPNRQSGPRSAHFTGVKSALKAPPGCRIIAGPPLSEFAFWAATHEPPKPPPISKPAWRSQRQPGDLAAEWTARELAAREAEDAKYVAEDEERLRTKPVDLSGNYARRHTYSDDGSGWLDWPPSDDDGGAA